MKKEAAIIILALLFVLLGVALILREITIWREEWELLLQLQLAQTSCEIIEEPPWLIMQGPEYSIYLEKNGNTKRGNGPLALMKSG